MDNLYWTWNLASKLEWVAKNITRSSQTFCMTRKRHNYHVWKKKHKAICIYVNDDTIVFMSWWELHDVNTDYIFDHNVIYKINIIWNVLQICKFLSWSLCGVEEGINNPLILPLQIRNNYLIGLLQYGLQFPYVCRSKIEWVVHKKCS